MSYPFCYLGPKCQLEPFFDVLTIKYVKQNGSRHVQFMLLEQALTRWRRLVVFKKARNLLRWMMCTALYHCTTTTIKMVIKVDTVCSCPGSCRDDIEQVGARWWRLVAFMKALDLLHRPPCKVLYSPTAMATGYRNDQQQRYIIWINAKLLYKSNWCFQSILILLAAVANNGCSFSHHCCRRTSPILTTHRGWYKSIYFYFDLWNLLNRFDGGIGTNMHKAAHPLGGVGSSNPHRWMGERLHHHGYGVC